MSEPPPNAPKILFFGVGSVGAVYLYLLSRVCNPTAVCRSNYDIVKNKGFVINSSVFGQNLSVKPNVVRSCDEAVAQHPDPFDYLVVCSKAIPGTIPQIIKPAVTPRHTVVVLIQNGMGIEQEYATAFPDNPILSVVLYCKAVQRPAGVIIHDEIEYLQIGSYPSSAPDTHALAFTELMRSAGARADHYSDVQLRRWYKLLVNVAWNPLCALSLCTDVEFLASSTDAADFVLDIMLEVRDVAQACGYEISKEAVNKQLDRAKARINNGAPVEPSMLQDAKEGRRMEVEAIVGNVVRLAREKGVTCPKMETIYIIVKALDSRMGRNQSSWPFQK